MTAREATDEILIQALASGRSYTQAAELAGVHSRTVDRRMTEPGFARQVSERRAAWATRTAGELVSMGSEATAVLREVLVYAERPADRLRAVNLVLSHGARLRHEVDLDVRLQDIEHRLDERKEIGS
jgi:hypothetical protein